MGRQKFTNERNQIPNNLPPKKSPSPPFLLGQSNYELSKFQVSLPQEGKMKKV